MAKVPTLKTISKLASCHVLLDFVEDTNPRLTKYLITLLDEGIYSSITEELLESLLQFYAEKVTNELLKAVVPCHLRELKINKCLPHLTFFGLTEVMKKCPHLHKISLKECDQLMSPGQFILWRRIGVNITALCLESCHNVTDQVVQSALRHIVTLRHLNISSCENITEKVFLLNEELQKKREFTPTHDKNPQYECSLVSVDVSGCPGITTTAVAHLTSLTGPTLKNVNLSWTSINLVAILSLAGYSLPAVIELVIFYYNKTNIRKDSKTDEIYKCLLEFQTTIEKLEQQLGVEIEVTNNGSEGQITNQSEERYLTKEMEPTMNSKSNNSEPVNLDSKLDKSEPKYKDLNTKSDISELKDVPLSGVENNVSQKQFKNMSSNSNQISQPLVSRRETALDTSGNSKNECIQLENVELEFPIYESNGAILDPCECESEHSKENKNKADEYKCECTVVTGEDAKLSTHVSVDDLSKSETDFIFVEDNSVLQTENGAINRIDETRNSNYSKSSELNQKSSSGNSKMCSISDHVNVSDEKDEDVSNYEAVDSTCLGLVDLKLTDGSFTESKEDNETSSESSVTFENSNQTNQLLPNTCTHDSLLENGAIFHNDGAVGQSMNDESSTSYSLPYLKCVNDNKETESGKTDDNNEEGKLSQNEDYKNHFQNHESQQCSASEAQSSSSSSTDASSDHYPGIETEDSLTVRNMQKALKAFNKDRIKQSYKPLLVSVDVTNKFSEVYETIGFDCLKEFLHCIPNLQKFGISWAGLTDEMVIELSPYLKDLRELSLIDCDQVTYGITEIGFDCRKLEKVDFNGIHFIKDIFLRPFLLNPELQCLYLAESYITDGTLFRLSARKIEKFQELDLSWCDEVTVQGLNALCRKPSTLKKLSFRHCPATTLTLALMAENFKNLQSLNICSVDEITDASVVYLVENLPNLQEVDLGWNSGLSDVAVIALLRSCIYLKKASLSGIKFLTSAPFLPIISDLPKFRRCQALFRFKLQERNVLAENGEGQYSSDEEYEELNVPHRSTTYAPNLQILELEYCDCVDDNHLAEIVAVCRGSLYIKDYFSETVKPVMIHAQKGKVYLPPK